MGASSSKNDGNKALLLCKERLRFIKQAVDLRYALSAAQLSYTQSLRNMGAALRQFAEAEISVDPSQSKFAPGLSTPQSSCASPSPFLAPELLGSPHVGIPSSPRLSNASYMRAAGSASVKFTIDTPSNHYVDEEGDDSLTFPMPPPPPFPEIDSSWDFFDPVDAVGTIKIPNGEFAMRQRFGKFAGLRQNVSPSEEANASRGKEFLTQDNIHSLDVENSSSYKDHGSMVVSYPHSTNNYNLERSPELEKNKGYSGVNGSAELVARTLSPESCISKIEKAERDRQKETEWEDSSKLVTHKAKELMSSVKEIEHRFIRASESGHEVSRMLETKKIRLSIHSEILGKSSDSFLPVLHLLCCKADNLSDRDTIHQVTKIITWRRSVSSRSSSSRNHLTSASKDDGVENFNDFVEEFSMISGSHSSTLDRLYAWERKLYDELKACESITKAYDRKCNQLRHQFAKDMNARVIDKTRAAVKDLHSRVRVTIQAVDLISRRIEKLRDEELQPQLAELMQGLIRMWKAMLECHQSQFMTISSAYQAKNSAPPSGSTDSSKQAAMNLRDEIECFRASFQTWVDTQKTYTESLNGWLQKCILQPHERSRGRKAPFSPRRALAPPIFILCRDWLAGIMLLPTEGVCSSLKRLVTNTSELLEHQKDDDKQAVSSSDDKKNEEERCESYPSTSLIRLKEPLMSTFECLAKFSEELVKVYEVVKRESQIARDAYVSSGWFGL